MDGRLIKMLKEIELSCLGGAGRLDPKPCTIVLEQGSTRCVSTPLGYFLEVRDTGWHRHDDIDGVNEHLMDYDEAPVEE